MATIAWSTRDRLLHASLRPVRPGEPFMASSVIGVAPEGQLRRAFLYYLERRRARPYHPFVHYISWFDIAHLTASWTRGRVWPHRGVRRRASRGSGACDSRVRVRRRLGRPQDAVAVPRGFPRGFAPLRRRQAVQRRLGVWLSPWGGYGDAKVERLSSAGSGLRDQQARFLAGRAEVLLPLPRCVLRQHDRSTG